MQTCGRKKAVEEVDIVPEERTKMDPFMYAKLQHLEHSSKRSADDSLKLESFSIVDRDLPYFND